MYRVIGQAPIRPVAPPNWPEHPFRPPPLPSVDRPLCACASGSPEFTLAAAHVLWLLSSSWAIRWTNPLILEDATMGTTLVSGQDQTLHVDVIRISVFRPFTWLRAGWRDMRRPASLAYGALIVAIGWTILVFCGTHPYLIAAAISGFLLVGPLMSAGLCELSRRYSLGQSTDFDDSLDGFKRNAPALFEFGVILAICAAVWFGISALIIGTVFHIGAPDMSETLYRGFLDSTNRTQVLAYIAIGGALATWGL